METKIMENLLLKEKINIKELSNGLKIYYMPKKGYTKQYAIFATKYGSIDSKFRVESQEKPIEVPEGIAHFLEHKLFEEEEGSIFDKFSHLGSNVNAYTNFTSTCYLFSSTDKFYENLELLVQFVQSPHFTEENVEKEKGIIEQEIRMYEDNPNWKVFFNALKALYHHHPVKIDIAGTVESINRITKEDLYTCYNTFYTPQNMILFIVGDLDEDEVYTTIEKNILWKNESIHDEVERYYPKEPDSVVQNKIEEKLSVSIPLFNIAFKDVDTGYGGAAFLKKDVITKMLLEMIFGRSSKLYKELYEDGLINDTFEGEYTGEKDYGHSMIGGESKNPDQVYQRVLTHIKELEEKGLNKNDFERIKRKYIGEHLRSYNSIEFIATTFVAYHFRDIYIFDYMDTIKQITFEELQRRFAEHFQPERSVLSVIHSK
ncbi:EF-P 5-aminopentanol modification-associated protein YfmH [Geosporobacter ferrireducens]|nr:pitrilysin family protein [Geosporobacter ferrireducens]MTI53931.1 insulinase family protein [Geosporobacter ferrireducens]